ncbi:glycoside hydrolase family 76 protein [Moniliophthora roreri MCA 2997]|uniref:Glycoside hydrolase family 76 protein n=1 Tax=Moniliophthora roreri (strain MCA 2997) TaxID=1381753 RepID=V2X1W6_MONRO|nr:glycoside hydrolase family 76 protein [Moniliophthora roreri MCA 2997]
MWHTDGHIHITRMFGYAAILAYTTYKDGQYLSAAQGAWDFARHYTLLEEDVKAQTKISELDYDHIQFICNRETMAGGTTEIEKGDVFWGWLTTLFLRLSALLYEATSNSTYLSAAKQSANFIQVHLTQSPGFVQEGISGDNCKIPPNLQLNASDTAAISIHGLSILSSFRANSSLMSLIEQSIATVTNQVGVWQNANGIQANDKDVLENKWFIDGLGGAHERFTSSNNLRNYTESFLAVQYNAVLELATEGQNNVYSGDWSGPPQSVPDVSSQAAASEILIAGIRLGPGPVNSPASTKASTSAETSTSAVTLTSANPSQPPNPTPEPIPTGAIVGGVIGSVTLMAIITSAFWIHRRRQLRNARALTPFYLGQNNGGETVHNARKSQGQKGKATFSQQEQLEHSLTQRMANSQQHPVMPPIEDVVRALYERFQLEAPPSYRPGSL